jgi:hypothetical protein
VYKIAFQYSSGNEENKAALNFHLTKREQKDILQSVSSADNTKGFEKLKTLLSNNNIADSVKTQ